MTNGEKYKTEEERKKAFESFCIGRKCGKCPVFAKPASCFFAWTELPYVKESQPIDFRLEREKRVQEVALQLLARTHVNVAYAFKLAEEYVCECERRENEAKKGGEG